jgi:hypothetical protein
MPFKILTTPKRILSFAVFVSCLTCATIWLDDHRISKSALPEVQATVALELNDVLSKSPEFSGLELGEPRRTRVVEHTPDSLTGFVEFNAMQQGSLVTLLVTWKTTGTNCLITKIVSRSSESPERVLWNKS